MAKGSMEERRDAFVDRMFRSSIDAMDVFSIYLGDRLGLYRSLANEGPATSDELAKRAGIAERYAREWLEQQASTGILEAERLDTAPADRRYSLPDAHTSPLIDPESPYSIAPLCRSVAALGATLPALLDAFRKVRACFGTRSETT